MPEMSDGITLGRERAGYRVPAPTILYRNLTGDGAEDVAASARGGGWGGVVTPNRTALRPYKWAGGWYGEPEHALVVGRYSVLPFYRETADDLAVLGYRLANSVAQHEFCADIKLWSAELAKFTPKTYTSGWDRLPKGSYVLKGATNSRKHKWNTHMFAATKADVPIVFARLLGDSLIAPQGIVAREYVPLRKLGEGINGLAFTHEYRLFYWRDLCVGAGFYWSSFEDASSFRDVPAAALELSDKIAKIITAGPTPDPEFGPGVGPARAEEPFATFYVLDVAETARGEWILIEVNDGQMSGLSEIDPSAFYAKLWAAVRA